MTAALACLLLLESPLARTQPCSIPTAEGARPCISQGAILCHILPYLQISGLWIGGVGSPDTRRLLLFQAAVAAAAPALTAVHPLPQHRAAKLVTAVVSSGLFALSGVLIAFSVTDATLPGLLMLGGATALAALAVIYLHKLALRGLPGSFTEGEAWLLAAGTTHGTLWLAFKVLSRSADATPSVYGHSEQSANRTARALRDTLAATLELDTLPVAIVLATVAAAALLAKLAAELAEQQRKPPRASAAAATDSPCGELCKGADSNGDTTNGHALQRLPVVAWAVAAAGASAYTAFMAAAAHATLRFVALHPSRSRTLAGWAAAVATALPLLWMLQRMGALRPIVLRKGFHALGLAMFSPVLLADPHMLAVSLAMALCLLLLVEAARAARVPWATAHINAFMLRFTDARDSGAITISHLSLLVGIASPLWLSLPPAGDHRLPVAAWSGLLSLGVADSVAAAVGSKLGRTPVHAGSCKTVEGTLAAAVSLWACFVAVGWSGWRPAWAALLSCALEAATMQLDNLVLPVVACVLCTVLCK